jgi:hypothetical protein
MPVRALFVLVVSGLKPVLRRVAGRSPGGKAKHKTIDNKEVCRALASTGAEGRELEVAHPSGVEPETF